MTYTDRRRSDRACVKARLLVELRQAEAAGRRVRLDDLSVKLRRSRSTLTLLWHELAAEGQIDYPTEARLNNGREPVAGPPDLAERIEAVREAKFRAWLRTGRTGLTDDELREVLP